MGKMSKTIFSSLWLQDKKMSWVKEDKNDKFSAYCTLCKKSFSLSNMGKQALSSHMRGKKHLSFINATNSTHNIGFFSNIKVPSSSITQKVAEVGETEPLKNLKDEILNEKNVTSSKTSLIGTNSRGISKFLERDKVTEAEIRWAFHVIEFHISMSAGGNSVQIMKSMFPDSSIASSMSLQRNKLSYVIVYGLSKYFRQELLDDINNSDFFSVAFDESLNHVAQKEQMDICIRFWSLKKNEVVCRYFSSEFLGKTTAVNLILAIKNSIKSLYIKKMIQVSMDGPYVNLKVLHNLKEDLKQTNPPSAPEIFDIGTCGLHTMHNAFKTAIKSTKWAIVEFLRAIYNLFKNVPARRADFISFSGSDVFPKKFCAVRWLHNDEVAQRAIEILPYLNQYILKAKQNKREPSSYSYDIVNKCISDKFIGPKLAFFKTLASETEIFLKDYQTDSPMIPFLYTDLMMILKSVMHRFILKEVLNNKTLTSIDVFDKKVLINPKLIDLGYLTRQKINSIDANDKEILLFRSDCLLILQHFCSKILIKSPLKYRLVRGLSCLDPAIMSSCEKKAVSRMKITLEELVEHRWLTGIQADKIDLEFRTILPKVLPISNCFTRENRLDHFWRDVHQTLSLSPDFMKFMKLVMTLSHGNASVERGFSVNKECLIENLHEESLVSQRHVWSGVKAAGGSLNVDINKAMIHHVRNSRQYYMEAIKEKKLLDSQKTLEEDNKKRSLEKIKLLHQKKQRLLLEAEKEVQGIDEEIALLK